MIITIEGNVVDNSAVLYKLIFLVFSFFFLGGGERYSSKGKAYITSFNSIVYSYSMSII